MRIVTSMPYSMERELHAKGGGVGPLCTRVAVGTEPPHKSRRSNSDEPLPKLQGRCFPQEPVDVIMPSFKRQLRTRECHPSDAHLAQFVNAESYFCWR